MDTIFLLELFFQLLLSANDERAKNSTCWYMGIASNNRRVEKMTAWLESIKGELMRKMSSTMMNTKGKIVRRIESSNGVFRAKIIVDNL